MKRLLWCLIFLIIPFMFSRNVSANDTISYLWENTVVRIPINKSIDDYKDLPKCYLVVNGEIDYSKVFTYIQGKGTETLRTVQTTYLRTYYRDYLACCEEYSSTQQITFIIYDDIPPTITLSNNNLDLPFGTEAYDFSKYVSVTDNNSNNQNMIIDINSNAVIFDKIGSYKVFISAIDDAGLRSEAEMIVNIVDFNPPSISYLGKSFIEVFDYDYNVLDYVKALDSYDGDISNRVRLKHPIDFTKLGKQTITFEVYDFNANYNSLDVEIEIVDTTKPTISLSLYDVILDVREIYDVDYFKNYIIKIKDNYDELTLDDVIIDISDIRYLVGNYVVKYQTIDSSLNRNEVELKVFLKEMIGPVIEKKQAVINVGESFQLLDYLNIVDEFDEKAYMNLEITSNNINTNKVGVYQVYFYCFNSSGEYTYDYLNVYVVEDKNNYEIDNPKTLPDVSTNENIQKFDFHEFVSQNYIFIIIGVVGIFVLINTIIKRKKQL